MEKRQDNEKGKRETREVREKINARYERDGGETSAVESKEEGEDRE